MNERPDESERRPASGWSFFEGGAPLVVFPRGAERGPAERDLALRACAERYLDRVGSIVFRGFAVTDRVALRRFAAGFGRPILEGWQAALLEPLYGQPRSAPPSMHAAHAPRWPATLWSWCERAEGPRLADTRDVYRRVPAVVRERLIARGVSWVHHFTAGDEGRPSALRGLTRAQVEAWCRARGIAYGWRDNGDLSIRLAASVVATHPRTGERVWFSQPHALPPARALGASHVGPACTGTELSSSGVCHADGSAIDPGLLTEVRDAFEACAVSVPWEQYDVLMLDNMLTAHVSVPAVGSALQMALTEPVAAGATV